MSSPPPAAPTGHHPAYRETQLGPGITEGLVELDGREFYAIPDAERMRPFLMSVISDGDRWMFVSSGGALTAGRRDATRPLFPYETDDRLHDAGGMAGPVTAIRVDGSATPWRPFRSDTATTVGRRLAKSVIGDTVVVEEDHPAIPLTFGYRWSSCERFGFVRRATLVNRGAEPIQVEIVDGLVNVMPYGLDPGLQQRMRNLTNAYKRSEVIDPSHRWALYTLESRVADRPEPTEALRCTSVWSSGTDGFSLTLDPTALLEFETGRPLRSEPLVTGLPGAYLVGGTATVQPGQSIQWDIVCDVALDHGGVGVLRDTLTSTPDLAAAIGDALDGATDRLLALMAPADALQRTGDAVTCASHFANVTYNCMRGGVPLAGYWIETADFIAFVAERNRHVHRTHLAALEDLPSTVGRHDLLESLSRIGDPHLIRLGLEYLPFGFSRRHGDPSRPWNEFSIRVTDDDGNPVRHFEGNWRDIFQNWEALCASFPDYLLNVISVFVNASTPDGFNPYRISRAGIDWEVPSADDPWSNIGYWGDHQIAYLLALLEASDRYRPGEVRDLLDSRLFTYADVPYRIVPYEDVLRDPKATIRFDATADRRSTVRVDEIGGDGRLVWSGDEIHLVTLAEKLIVPALAKLASFVPGGGIWMNTQRPEWNDANNALVGNGLSMVTLLQLRRYLDHLRNLVAGTGPFEFSTAVAEWLAATTAALRHATPMPDPADADRHRRSLMDALGGRFSEYRARVHDTGLEGRATVDVTAIDDLCTVALEHLDATIATARRDDGLFHSYNILRLDPVGTTADVEHLDEMLEGQVAVLAAGVLGPSQSADLLDAMFSSRLHRTDIGSFVLYPPTRPRPFLERNVIPAAAVERNPLLTGLLEAGDRSILYRDARGCHRFNAGLEDRAALHSALNEIAIDRRWGPLVEQHRNDTLATYQEVFGHQSYTGRSRSMYAYEGIGSVYWHMVAKLLVAIQQTALDSAGVDVDRPTIDRLITAYWRVRQGMGRSTPAGRWGAIPTDPHSHSPAHAGAQQPGMTGLAKEEVLARPLELGLWVHSGEIRFTPLLVRPVERLATPLLWNMIGADGHTSSIGLDTGTYGFTFCQIPIVVRSDGQMPRIDVTRRDGTSVRCDGLAIDRALSTEIFGRTGTVTRIDVTMPTPTATSH